MSRLKAFLPSLVVVLAATFSLAAIIEDPHWRVDDAYIVARYAENVVQHGQLTWNVGSAPVEGFTGYSLLGVMILASILHIPPLDVTSLLGIVSLFVGAALVWSSHKPLGASRLAGAIAAALFLCAPEQTTHSVSGLETELFMTLTIACAFVAMCRSENAPGKGRLWLLPLLTTALVFTRPEGMAIGGAFLLAVLIRERSAWRAWLPFIVLELALPVSALHIYRRIHFGDWLPNTYYAKLGKSHEIGVFASSFAKHAQAYVIPAIAAMIAIVIIARAIGGSPSSLRASAKSARRIFFFGAIASYVAVGSSYLRSDLVMNYSERFAFHLFGLSSLVVLLAISEIERRLQTLRHQRAMYSAAFILGCTSIYLSFAHALERLPLERHYRASYDRAMAMHYQPAARWLGKNLPANATLAVYPDAGLVPYTTRLRTLDFGKLNDTFLAREARDSRAVVDYFFRQKPDALMLNCRQGLEKGYDEAADAILADPRFAASYEIVEMTLYQGTGIALFRRR